MRTVVLNTRALIDVLRLVVVAAQVGGWLAGWLTLPLTLPLAVLYSDALHAQVHRGARGAAQGLASFSVATGWLSDAQCVIGSEGL